jgi:hypothetical protein
MKTKRMRTAMLALAVAALVALVAVPAYADPCLVVYPGGTCFYHYDTNEYYTVMMGDPLYDPMYDRGGEVLIEVLTNDIAYTVYQAPGLAGFTPSTYGNDGFFFIGNDFDLIVDGFNNMPTTYVNILLVFEADPSGCTPMITVDGNPAMYDADLGWYYPIGDLEVSTPTPDGNNYSDTMTFAVHFELCSGMSIWGFSDEDHDLMWTDSECFTAFSHDSTVPVNEKTWGGIKVIFGDQ